MSSILVRNLDEEVKDGLKERARRNGRSMEAEARALLTAAIIKPEAHLEGLGARIRARFAHIDTEGLVFPRSDEPVRWVDFSEPDSPL